MNRREFLRLAALGGAAACGGHHLTGCTSTLPRLGSTDPLDEQRRLIIVPFGGGTRCSESIDDPQHHYIPRLWNQLVPRGTLFANMRVEYKVVHPNSTGSIMTGHWEYDDIDWSKPVANPTIFEIHRRARRAPDTDAWAFVYASILAKTGESSASGYGAVYGANVVEPPTISRSTAEEMDRRLAHAATVGPVEAQIGAIADCERLVRKNSIIQRQGLRSDAARRFVDTEFAQWKASHGTTSHDAFLADLAIKCMGKFSPRVMAVDFGEIDCAHYGSWSRYVEAIRRTDELTWRLWCAVQDLDDYRGRTLMLILPDHGRELDRADDPGFVHHSDFYTDEGAGEGCRRVWMLNLGPNITPGRVISDPVPITSAATTGLHHLGLGASTGAARSVLPAAT